MFVVTLEVKLSETWQAFREQTSFCSRQGHRYQQPSISKLFDALNKMTVLGFQAACELQWGWKLYNKKMFFSTLPRQLLIPEGLLDLISHDYSNSLACASDLCKKNCQIAEPCTLLKIWTFKLCMPSFWRPRNICLERCTTKVECVSSTPPSASIASNVCTSPLTSYLCLNLSLPGSQLDCSVDQSNQKYLQNVIQSTRRRARIWRWWSWQWQLLQLWQLIWKIIKQSKRWWSRW